MSKEYSAEYLNAKDSRTAVQSIEVWDPETEETIMNVNLDTWQKMGGPCLKLGYGCKVLLMVEEV